MFTSLSPKEIRQIVLLQFDKIKSMLAQNDVKVEITDSAIDWIANQGFDPIYGARPLKRLMQKHILNELSKQILAGKVDKDKIISVDYFDGNELVFR